MKSNFILTVSHEFRTPLTAISSTAMILDVIGKDIPEIQKHIKVINESVKGLNYLIENIITYSSTEKEQLDTNYKLFNAEELLNELIDWAKEKVREINKLSDNDPSRLSNWDDVKDQFMS